MLMAPIRETTATISMVLLLDAESVGWMTLETSVCKRASLSDGATATSWAVGARAGG